MRRLLVLTFLCFALGAMSLSGVAQGYADGYLAGQEAGQEDCDRTDHFVRGVVGGIIYIGYALVDPPNSPPESRLSSIAEASSDYQEGYIVGYEKEWQSCRLRNALFGSASWVFFYMILAAMI